MYSGRIKREEGTENLSVQSRSCCMSLDFSFALCHKMIGIGAEDAVPLFAAQYQDGA